VEMADGHSEALVRRARQRLRLGQLLRIEIDMGVEIADRGHALHLGSVPLACKLTPTRRRSYRSLAIRSPSSLARCLTDSSLLVSALAIALRAMPFPARV